MRRTIRFRALFVLALLSVILAGTAVVGAAATALPTGPVLAASVVAPGTIAVVGRGFTPGGRVALALFDVWGTPRNETNWITASSTTYGRNGSADPGAGFVTGGTFEQRFDHLCGASVLVRAHDQGTFTDTEWLEVDLSEFEGTHFGEVGRIDPARGYAPGC